MAVELLLPVLTTWNSNMHQSQPAACKDNVLTDWATAAAHSEYGM